MLRRGAAILGAATAGIGGGLAVFSGLAARRAERLAPPDGGFVEVDGARLHYVDIGAGPVILMIHGLGGQLRNFTYALADRLSGEFRVIAIDRPGSGYSTLSTGAERSLAGQAAVIGRFIEAMRLDRPLVVGHSLGGALALALALDRPDLVGGLALVAPLTQAIAGIPRVFRPLYHPSPVKRALIAWTLAVPMGRLSMEKSRRVIFGPDPAPDDFEVRGGGLLTLRPSAFHAASTEVCIGTDALVAMAERYPSLKPPLGILFGRGDRILSPALHGERTAAMVPDAEIELIDGGHMIPVTAPDAVARFVRRQAARIAPA